MVQNIEKKKIKKYRKQEYKFQVKRKREPRGRLKFKFILWGGAILGHLSEAETVDV